uniref:Ig-like domain-containing protein n=1 Tax=Spermophilus dauricus TaxID=99837 RepID=A0A8C9UX00_SPEDA
MFPGAGGAWPKVLKASIFCFSDCVPLSGPSKVTGTVGGSLTVHCHYGEEFKDNDKLWCKNSLFYCKDIVKTRGSEGEVQSGRVSISDHPANLSFTVTMERLTLEDAGSYECRVDTPWHKGFDPFFEVEVVVQPGEPLPPASGHQCRPQFGPVPEWKGEERSPGGPSLPRGEGAGASRPREVWGPHLELGQKRHLQQSRDRGGAAGQSEPYYTNLTLQTWSLQEEPVPPRQAEVEYSMLAFPREEPHYSSVVFDSPRPDSSASGAPSQRPHKEVPEYSVIRKPRAKEG